MVDLLPKDANYRGRPNSLGADPELFLLSSEGEVVAPDLPEEKSVKWDNNIAPDGAQLELHPSPQLCRSFFMDAIRNCLIKAREFAARANLALVALPAIQVSAQTRKKFPASANIFGCDPDWDAYTCEIASRRMNAKAHPWRYGGGHIHVGAYKQTCDKFLPGIIQVTDVVAGLFQVALGIEGQAARQRRALFGQAGLFRIQPHGYEYRTLDNSWLLHPKLTCLFAGLVMDSLYVATSGNKLAHELLQLAPTARGIINECDTSAARKLWASEVAPRLEKLIPYSDGNVSIKYPTGLSECVWATELVCAFDTRVRPELSGSGALAEAWSFELGPTQSRSPWFWHGTYSNGGFEEFFNPTLAKAYAFMHENKCSYESQTINWSGFTAPAIDPRKAQEMI